MIERLRARNEWKFFAVLPKADGLLASVWWVVLVLRGALPAIFAIAMGVLVAAVQRGEGLAGPLTFVGVVSSCFKCSARSNQTVSANLGESPSWCRTGFRRCAWLTSSSC